MIVFFFFLLYPTINCNFLPNLCPITHTDIFYQSNLKISQKIINTQNDCMPKKTEYVSRKIFVFNISNSNFNEKSGYDKTYNSLAVCLEGESKIIPNYLFSDLLLVLEIGDHIISDNEIENKYAEFFRRSVVNLTIMAENGSKANVYLRTNKFFLFVSCNLIVKNVIFFGNDINLNFQEVGFTDKFTIFCQESDIEGITNKSECSLRNASISKINKINNYGFLNVEDILDENITIKPKLTINNCSFLNFYPTQHNGFLSLISISPFSTIIEILNSQVKNSFFYQSLIYYSKYKYDGIYSRSIFDTISKDFQKNMKKTILIENSQILNYNYIPLISDESFHLVYLFTFDGNFSLKNCRFDNVSQINSGFHLTNINQLTIFNNSFINYEKSSLFYLQHASQGIITQNILSDFVNGIETFKFDEVKNLKIDNLNVEKLLLENISSLITIIQSTVEIKKSYFRNLETNNLIFQEQNSLTISNSTFENCSIKNNLIYFSSDNGDFIVDYTIFKSIFGDMYLFTFQKGNLIEINNTILENINVYTIYDFSGIGDFIAENSFLKNSYFFYIWESTIVCKYLLMRVFSIESNKIGICFIKILYTEFYTTFMSVFIYNNSFLLLNGGNIIYIQVGYFFGVGMKVIDNNFLNPDIFNYVFEFVMESQVIVEDCFLKDSGIISKKNRYNAFPENSLFSIWEIIYASFINCIMFASDKVELASGFISAVPVGYTVNLLNCTFIYETNNTFFDYKGILLDNFVQATFISNKFYNMKCNLRQFTMKYGGVVLSSSTSFRYGKNQNNFKLYMENNQFFNCNCFNGGSLAIIAINEISIINTKIYDSQSNFDGGAIFIAGSETCNITNLEVINSQGLKGGAVFFLNILNLNMKEIRLKNIKTESIGGIYIKKVPNCSIQDIFIFNSTSNFSAGSIYLFRTELNLERGIFNLSIAISFGGILWADNQVSINFSNIICENSYAFQGGSFYIKDINEFYLANTFTVGTKSSLDGAFLLIEHCIFSDFRNLTVTKSGSENGINLIYIKEDNEKSEIYFFSYNCLFNNGSCVHYSSTSFFCLNNALIYYGQNSGLFFNGLINVGIELNNVSFVECKSINHLILLSSVNIIAKNLTFDNNHVENYLITSLDSNGNLSNVIFRNNSVFSIFYLEDVVVQINNINILNQNDVELYLEVYHSTTYLNNSLFCCYENDVGKQSLLTYQTSEIHFGFCYFVNNTNNVIQIIDSLKIIFENCYFSNNTGAAEGKPNDISIGSTLPNINPNILIIDCIFEVVSSISCLFTNSNETQIIRTNYFLNSSNTQSQAIFFELNLNIEIFQSNFSLFTKNAVFINNNNPTNFANYSLEIRNSSFNYNKGLTGSALYIQGDSNIVFVSVVFSNNQAIIQKNNETAGIASCVFYQSTRQKSTIFLIFQSLFLNNVAEYLAPTIFSQSYIQVDDKTYFENNSDSFNFSNKIFSYPIRLEIIYFKSEGIELFNLENDTTLVINSGGAIQLFISITDYFGQTLVFDNKSIFSIKKQESFKEMLFTKNNIKSSSEGVIYFNDLTINIRPNHFFSLTLSGVFGFLPQEQQKISQELKFYSRNCTSGEIILVNNSCIKCPPETFSLVNPMLLDRKFHKCQQCPANSECSGGFNITPKKGYYRYSNTSIKVIECFSSDACLGNYTQNNLTQTQINLIQIHGACLEGSFGPLCSFCNRNYGRYNEIDVCKQCSSLLFLVIIRTLLSFLFLCFYLFINSIWAENYDAEKKKISNAEIYSKILINHCQQINIIMLSVSKFTIAEIPQIFTFGEYLSFTNEQAFTNDCLFQSFLGEKIEFFSFVKVLMNTILPIGVSLLSFIFWIFLVKLKDLLFSEKKTIIDFKSKFFLFCMLSIYIFYPLIIKSCFGLFECINLDPDVNRTFAKKNLDMVCWNEEHLKYVLFYAFPGLVIWGIGFPLFLIWRLKNYIKLAKKASQKSAQKHLAARVSKKISMSSIDLKNMKSSAFFYKGMKEQNYYWESLILYRKLLLCLFSSINFAGNSKEYKWLILLIILILFFNYTCKYFPYSGKNANYLEIGSLCICIFTIYTCLFMESQIFFSFKLVCAIGVIFFNFCFILLCVIPIVYTVISRIKEKFTKKEAKNRVKSRFNRTKKIISLK